MLRAGAQRPELRLRSASRPQPSTRRRRLPSWRHSIAPSTFLSEDGTMPAPAARVRVRPDESCRRRTRPVSCPLQPMLPDTEGSAITAIVPLPKTSRSDTSPGSVELEASDVAPRLQIDRSSDHVAVCADGGDDKRECRSHCAIASKPRLLIAEPGRVAVGIRRLVDLRLATVRTKTPEVVVHSVTADGVDAKRLGPVFRKTAPITGERAVARCGRSRAGLRESCDRHEESEADTRYPHQPGAGTSGRRRA